MVLGTGIDLIETVRIRNSINKFGDRFLARIYTSDEIAYCSQKKHNADESFAARFAAKEATAKALGTGISRGISWLEIEVRRARGQRPEIHLSGRAAERAAQMGVQRTSLSITHSRELAMAMVIMDDCRSDL